MLRRMILSFVVSVAALLVTSLCSAQTPQEIESARQKGIEYLKGEQYDDGSWEFENHDVGITSLCAIALIENGVSVSDPIIEKAHRFVQKNMEDEKGTYDIALAILFLSRVGDRENRPKIRDLAARLIAGQNVEGGWGYTCPLVSAGILSNPDDRPKPAAGVGDNSCTQFAVLGLWVSTRWGVDISDAMNLVADRFIETQREDGGWPYRCEEWSKLMAEASETGNTRTAKDKDEEEKPGEGKPKRKKDKDKEKEKDASNPPNQPPPGNALPGASGDLPGAGGAAGGTGATPAYEPSSPSMTFAGLFCLTVARATAIRAEQVKTRSGKPGTAPGKSPKPVDEKAGGGKESDSLMSDPSFADGLSMAGKFAASISNGSARYFMWSVERMGVVLGLDKFGETVWFEKGAKSLLATQEMDGSWKSPNEAWGALADTSFAILFLRKANLGSDISRLLSGEPADRFQNVTQEGKPRYANLEDALKAAKDGDRIRVDGVGPFKLGHVEIDKSLTIEAGLGYQPVFQYDVGYDKDGRRSRPQENADARHMIRVSQGTLTLEGIELQMDPPELGPAIPWAAVVAQGGNLRILNCSISEGNRQGMAAIRVSGPGKFSVQNSQLVGGRSAVEVTVTGEQNLTLDNCILFSKSAVIAVDGPKADGTKCSLTLSHSAVLANDIFMFKGLTQEIDIVSNGVAYQGDWLGSTMQTAASGHQGINWTGSENVFDVKRWIGNAGKANPTIKDAKTWNTFWGGSDTTSSNRTIAFAGRKPLGSFNHTVKGEDFEFGAQSSLIAYRRKTGIDPLIVGPGVSYLRYRESFDYRSWLDSSETAAAK